MVKKILFISHDATRTGAPIIFLNLLKWFKENTSLSFQILLREGGQLENEFKAIAPVFIFPKNHKNNINLTETIRSKIEERLGLRKLQLQKLKNKLIKQNFSLIYSNTAVNGEVLEFLSDLQCPVISHIHELQWVINSCTSKKDFQSVINHSDFYIAVSEAVKENLIKNHQIPQNKIEKIYGFVPTYSTNQNKLTKEFFNLKNSIYQQFNIPPEAKIICASGTTHWRKGSDLFIQLASLIRKKYRDNPVYFIWIGGQIEGLYWTQLAYDIKKLNLKKYVHFLGIKSNPLEYFASADVFTLLSREDPFPLVCLEAASLGKPIVCFDNAGGMKEFIENDCGFVVPYLDLDAMATKVIDLLRSSELNETLGKTAQTKVKQRHDIEMVAPQIIKVINQFMR